MSAAPPRFRLAVVADLAAGRVLPRRRIDRESFDEAVAALAPELSVELPDRLADGPDRVLSLQFESWRDFTPSGLVARVPALSRVLDLARGLADKTLDAEAAARAADGIAPPAWIAALGGGEPASQPSPPSAPADAPATAPAESNGDLDSILDLVDTDGAASQRRSENAPAERARDLVAAITTRDRRPSEAGADTSELEARLSAQLDALLADPAFRALERGWAGLHWLIQRANFREDLEIEVVAAPLDEAAAAISSLADGDDVDLVLAAYELDASARDHKLAQELAGAGEEIQAVVLTGLAPEFFGDPSWEGLAKGETPRARFERPEYDAWRSLRGQDVARWWVPVADRIAVRARYGADGASTRGVPYEEATPGGLHVSAAWGVASVVLRSWERTRACVQISGTRHGLIPDLALIGAGEDASPLAGRLRDDRREDLEAIGITSVQVYRRDVAFVGAVRTFRSPERYPDTEATADAAQQVTLAYQIVASRLVKLLGRTLGALAGQTHEAAAGLLREAVVQHFSRPGKPLGPDHVGVELREDADDPTLTAVGVRVQPEIQVGGRPVNLLLQFLTRL
ncbi:MAG: type VI secretion system contractile sheath large subunit [Myxococcota bacterium]